MPWRRIGPRRLGRWLRGEIGPAEALGLGLIDRDELAWQAQSRFAAGRVAEAREVFALLATLWPRDSAHRLGLGACHQIGGELAAAERIYDEILGAEPDNPHALANRAEVKLLTGRFESARADLAAARAALDRWALPDRDDLFSRLERLREVADIG